MTETTDPSRSQQPKIWEIGALMIGASSIAAAIMFGVSIDRAQPEISAAALGFWGGILGGAIGGLFTIAAAIIAWRGAFGTVRLQLNVMNQQTLQRSLELHQEQLRRLGAEIQEVERVRMATEEIVALLGTIANSDANTDLNSGPRPILQTLAQELAVIDDFLAQPEILTPRQTRVSPSPHRTPLRLTLRRFRIPAGNALYDQAERIQIQQFASRRAKEASRWRDYFARQAFELMDDAKKEAVHLNQRIAKLESELFNSPL